MEQSKAELQLASALNPCWRSLFFCEPDERAEISLRLKREALAAAGGLAAGQSADQVPAPQPAKALRRLRRVAINDPGVRAMVEEERKREGPSSPKLHEFRLEVPSLRKQLQCKTA